MGEETCGGCELEEAEGEGGVKGGEAYNEEDTRQLGKGAG
jgi:hypothetical protein